MFLLFNRTPQLLRKNRTRKSLLLRHIVHTLPVRSPINRLKLAICANGRLHAQLSPESTPSSDIHEEVAADGHLSMRWPQIVCRQRRPFWGGIRHAEK